MGRTWRHMNQSQSSGSGKHLVIQEATLSVRLSLKAGNDAPNSRKLCLKLCRISQKYHQSRQLIVTKIPMTVLCTRALVHLMEHHWSGGFNTWIFPDSWWNTHENGRVSKNMSAKPILSCWNPDVGVCLNIFKCVKTHHVAIETVMKNIISKNLEKNDDVEKFPL